MLSVVIVAHNEEKEIKACLASIKGLADEIILVDNQSTDNTVRAAQSASIQPIKVYSHKNDPLHLNRSKNFGFQKATGDWILSLDADERVSKKLKQQIKASLKRPTAAAYKFPRKNIIFGQWIRHGLWYPDEQIRLFQKGRGKFPAEHNHEKLVVQGPISSLTGHLIHYNYRSVTQYIDKINHTYSDNEAENFLKSAKKVHWYDAIRLPLADFLTNFFAREAYKDGLHGLVLSLLQAFYTFVVFAKIWERQGFTPYQHKNFLTQAKGELDAKAKEFNHWYRQKTSIFSRLFSH